MVKPIIIAGHMRTGSTLTVAQANHALQGNATASRNHDLHRCDPVIITTRHPYTWVTAMLEWTQTAPTRNNVAALVHSWTHYYSHARTLYPNAGIIQVEQWWWDPEGAYAELVDHLELDSAPAYKHIDKPASPVRDAPAWSQHVGDRAMTKTRTDPTSLLRSSATKHALGIMGYDTEPPTMEHYR